MPLRSGAPSPAPSNMRVDDAALALEQITSAGVDMEEMGLRLEDDGVASFHDSFAHLLQSLNHKVESLTSELS